MAEQLFPKDDMIEFSQKLDAQNFNVKAYRKRNTGHNNRNNKKLLQSTDFILSDYGQEAKNDKSALKTLRTTQVFSAKRLSSTSAVRKRSDLNRMSFTKTARTKINSIVQSLADLQQKKDRQTSCQLQETKEKDIIEGKFSKQEKQYAKKGPLKNKHLQNWLNQILLEYCRDQVFDSTIENSALKKYGIDKNSLLSKGIKPQNLERIYQSLFVYSMGFNTLLKEIGENNSNIRKTFWKVYAILLQYCSDGEFQTMIGEIQRDKVKKMQIMKKEIQKRQQIIENNEQINQQKNAKIFKELKQLRDENSNLENDKNVLMEDYKEAQQAFNQEVSLRLKFQNKINQIHGVHRELGIKHQKLYDDLQFKQSQYSSIVEKINRLSESNIILKNDLQCSRKQNRTLKENGKYSEELIQQLKSRLSSLQIKEIQWKHKKDAFNVTIYEKQKKQEQLKNQIKNLQLMVLLREQSEKELQKQYKRALDQNKQLVNSLQNQLQQLNKYMYQKRQFNDTHSRLYAEVLVLGRNITQKQIDIQKKRIQIKQLKDSIRLMEIQVQTIQTKNKNINISLSQCYLKMEEMKKIKNCLEEEVLQLKNKEQIYKGYYKDKQKIIKELTQKNQDLEKNISQFNIVKKTLQSRLLLVNQKLSSEEQINKKKIQKYKKQIKAFQVQAKQLKEEAQVKRNDAIKYINLYQDTFNKLKDQIFERNDLQLRYNQSLCVVQSQTDHIKQLNIKISEVQQKNEDISRKIKGLQFVMQGKQKTYKMQILQLSNALKQAKQLVKLKKMFIHPMLYEDLLSRNNMNQTTISQLSIENKRIKLEAKEIEVKKAQVLQDNNNKQIFQHQLYELKEQLGKYKYKSMILQQQLSKTQQNQTSYHSRMTDQLFKEKEQKYLEFIKQKSSRIQNLLQEVQKMQDSNNQMLIRVEQSQTKMKQTQQQLQILHKEKTKIQADKQLILAQKLNLVKQKQNLASKVDELAQKLQNLSSLDSQPIVVDPQSRNSKSRPKYNQLQMEEQNTEKTNKPGWRNDFSKKMKNACNYYKK